MVTLAACRLFCSKTTQCHLCCVSVLAAKRFERSLKYRVWVEEGKISSFLPNFSSFLSFLNFFSEDNTVLPN